MTMTDTIVEKLNNIALQDTLNSDAISMDNVLAYAIAQKFNGVAAFNKLCNTRTRISIFSFTEGFSESEIIEFYHAYKPSLLNYLRFHARANDYQCGFHWAESAMQSKGYNADDTARAMYEGLIEGGTPTAAHIELATQLVHLAAESLIDAHQEQIIGMVA